MFTVSPLEHGKEEYYLNRNKEEQTDRMAKGYWYGLGAARLGIREKEITEADFCALYSGFDREGKKLTANAGSKERMPGYDMTFGVDKSVSIAWAFALPTERQRIEAAVLSAVSETMKTVQGKAFIRVQNERVPAGLVVGLWLHTDARAVDPKTMPDPHLHVHATVMNVGVTQDKHRGALDGTEFFSFQKAMGARFQLELSEKLEKLNYPIALTEHGVEIISVSKELKETFSKRTKKIETESPKEKFTYRQQKARNLRSREEKRVHTQEELLLSWKEQAKVIEPNAELLLPDLRNKKEHNVSVAHRAEVIKREADNYRALSKELKRAGKKVLGCSLNGSDVEVFKKAGIKSHPLDQYLTDVNRRSVVQPIAVHKFLNEFKAFTGQISMHEKRRLDGEVKAKERMITPGTVVIVNVAADQLQNSRLKELQKYVERRGGHIIAVEALQLTWIKEQRREQEQQMQQRSRAY